MAFLWFGLEVSCTSKCEGTRTCKELELVGSPSQMKPIMWFLPGDFC